MATGGYVEGAVSFRMPRKIFLCMRVASTEYLANKLTQPFR